MVLLGDLLSLIEPIDSIDEAVKNISISSVASLQNAQKDDLSFLASGKFRAQLEKTSAGVVLVTEKDRALCPENCVSIIVKDPYLSYARLSHFFDLTPKGNNEIHSTAIVDESVVLGYGVTIAAYAVVSKGVVIADNAFIGSHCTIDEYVEIGQNTRLQARVSIAHHCIIGRDCLIQSGTVIGSNGFGYAPLKQGWQAIAQLGRVRIGDRVEIGANCAVDRGAIDDTVIEDDVIIDNMVQVAHNVRIGRGSAFASQVGIAGSTSIGAGCTVGGQSGFAGHINIADQSHFTGQAMVTKGTAEGGLYSSGIPAQSNRDWRRMIARLRQLERLNERLTELENKNK